MYKVQTWYMDLTHILVGLNKYGDFPPLGALYILKMAYISTMLLCFYNKFGTWTHGPILRTYTNLGTIGQDTIAARPPTLLHLPS